MCADAQPQFACMHRPVSSHLASLCEYYDLYGPHNGRCFEIVLDPRYPFGRISPRAPGVKDKALAFGICSKGPNPATSKCFSFRASGGVKEMSESC